MDMDSNFYSNYQTLCIHLSQLLRIFSNSKNFRRKMALLAIIGQTETYFYQREEAFCCLVRAGLAACFVWKWGLDKEPEGRAPSLGGCHQVPCGHSAICVLPSSPRTQGLICIHLRSCAFLLAGHDLPSCRTHPACQTVFLLPFRVY